MNRQITITFLACFAGLWLAAASAEDKFNPNQVINPNLPPLTLPPIMKPPVVNLQPADQPAQDKFNPNQVINPNLPPTVPPPVVPPSVIPPPVVKLPPTTSPAAPTGSPAIEPKVPPGTLPVDPTGGHIGERELEAAEAARNAARAEKLADQESGLDHEMGAGPGIDRPGSGTDVDRLGFGEDDSTFMERFCKMKSARLFPGLCPGRGGDLPSDGDLSGFYDTKRPPSSTDPGGSMSFEGPRAGSRVPSRGGQASDDDTGNDDGPKPTSSWTDDLGYMHNETILIDNKEDGRRLISGETYDNTGEYYSSYSISRTQDRGPDAQPGDYTLRITESTHDGHVVRQTHHCRNGRCTPDSQPGESGYGQIKARPWFCTRNPEAEGCKPTAPGSQIDPAHPDGEGSPGGQRPATHRLSSGAVSDPGPADREIRGTTGGGGSGPLDIVDPIQPDRPR